MVLECRTGELLARAASIYYDDHGHSALKHYAALKGLIYHKTLYTGMITLGIKSQVIISYPMWYVCDDLQL